MTTSAMHCPRYAALSYDGECVEADNSLAVVLAALTRDHDPNDPEELVIWKDGQTVAAVMREDGSFAMFERVEPAPARKPPPGKPAKGKARRR